MINHRNDFPDGPSQWFGKLKMSTFISKNVIYALQTVTGDSVVIYRCYVIWQSIYIIIVPIIMLLATIATAVGSVWSADNLPDGATIFSSNTLPWITSFWAISLSMNVICTSLLFYKIWTTTADDRRKQTVQPILLTMVDAALLYTVSLTIFLILFAIKSNGQTFMRHGLAGANHLYNLLHGYNAFRHRAGK
ncbi:hypothetical protein EVG20_g7071 [Dentipellis fragilis]|uniref:Uncharacterized protein n=1 Tax=Dentipellis fragilis TaxID=205917 RepID=A0A4Y9YI90_9AGAM|nr:hypothetical protein EVG20_g7071 [Dentipellis fragilis]